MRGLVSFGFRFSCAVSFALVPAVVCAGSSWARLGDGGTPGSPALNAAVNALHADGGDLYVGGAFTDAGGVPAADYLAKWNGTSWSAVGPLNGAVNAIAMAGGTLYVGGAFTNAGGNTDLDFLAAWNGVAWQGVCNSFGPALGGSVFALHVVGNTLYIGGTFQDGAGIALADYLLTCDRNTGQPGAMFAAPPGMSGPIYALASDNAGTLYAGGSASNIDGNPAADFIAAFDGTWRALGSGPGVGGGAMNASVRALVSDGVNVYAGGEASDIAGIAGANRVARWDGTWHAMGSNYFSTPGSVRALARFGPFVFAGGNFLDANADPLADSLVYWDGAAWHALGSNGSGNGALNAATNAIAAVGTRLVAGGAFTSAGGDTLARFVAQTALDTVEFDDIFADGFE
jgi:hypothetical protein